MQRRRLHQKLYCSILLTCLGPRVSPNSTLTLVSFEIPQLGYMVQLLEVRSQTSPHPRWCHNRCPILEHPCLHSNRWFYHWPENNNIASGDYGGAKDCAWFSMKLEARASEPPSLFPNTTSTSFSHFLHRAALVSMTTATIIFTYTPYIHNYFIYHHHLRTPHLTPPTRTTPTSFLNRSFHPSFLHLPFLYLPSYFTCFPFPLSCIMPPFTFSFLFFF